MTMTIATTKDAVVQFKEGVDALLEKRDYFMQKILPRLTEGRDYYTIKGKRSLGKAGAERLAAIFQLTAVFHKDRDAMEAFKDIPGLIAYTCNLSRKGELAGQGRGASSLKSCNNDPNKAIKMAQKSAFIDGVVRTAGLSDIFTSDLEDMPLDTISPYQPQERLPVQTTKSVAIAEPKIADEYEEEINEKEAERARFYEDVGCTEKQKKFLQSLIIERVVEPEERERWLQETESLSKRDASDTISHFLEMARA